MQVGLNYPWAFNQYGLYFGPHPALTWMDRWLDRFADNITEVSELGLRVVRIFLVCAGENYGELALSGRRVDFNPPPVPDPKFIEDLERMLAILKDSNTGVKLIPSLVDFGFFGPVYGNSGGRQSIVRSAGVQNAFFDGLLEPFLAAARPFAEQIYAWEVMNEPYWNCSFISPPIHRGLFRLMPRIPLVNEREMREFLAGALRRIEAAGFDSTVGHRFYSDLERWPAGTRPQFHYYAKNLLWLGDPQKIPEFAETGGAFVGEIDAGLDYGRLWPELDGVDKDPARRVFERLSLLERKGYKLALLWPENGWSCPDEPDFTKWGVIVKDPLKLSNEAKEGVLRFTRRSL